MAIEQLEKTWIRFVMAKAFITDYVTEHDIKKKILDVSTKFDKDAEILLVWHEIVNKKYIDKFPNLKGIVKYGVGYDNIDIEYANKKNIVVCNVPDYGVNEVSDTAIAMIMDITRCISRYNFLSKSYKDTWEQNTLPLKRISNLMLGVIGAGRIGSSVILKANAIGFETCFYDPYKESGYDKVLKSKRFDSLENLLNHSDIISIHTPLTDETRGMVNKNFIQKMKHNSILVNTARGKIFKNLDDLYYPLKRNLLFGVALDVLPYEPPKTCKLIDAWKKNEKWIEGRLIINPHVAFYSYESYKEMLNKALMEAKRILQGKKTLNPVGEIH